MYTYFSNFSLFITGLQLNKEQIWGSSLVVWWLGFSAFTAMVQIQSLVGKLRSQKLRGMAQKKKTNKNLVEPKLQGDYKYKMRELL